MLNKTPCSPQDKRLSVLREEFEGNDNEVSEYFNTKTK